LHNHKVILGLDARIEETPKLGPSLPTFVVQEVVGNNTLIAIMF